MEHGPLQFPKRVQKTDLAPNGSVEFLNDWIYFSNIRERDFGELTRTGPHAGMLGAFSVGVRFGTRCGDLISKDPRTRQ
ncbi:Histidine phosphatase superfamily, clade-2 [Penicillium digitatum]|uniref:Histidine phosphatase superfamily, clade-2 n=1 Tax=Penicillium digitatum TaxID=36651 RepID=A0A7T7BLQ2_PENDI|nr:Histidine phosphatase superfamily, clade-2 [Penicillium digitatum]